MAKIKKGKNFGDWRLKKFLGSGGNGHVWLAENSRGETAAIKILANLEGKNKAKVYARFNDEVQVVQKNNDIEGLLPLIDSYLPDEIGNEFPWYVMPVATPLTEYLKDTNFESSVQKVLEVGRVLARLHERGISHRDIKPANILILQDNAYLADFGLVDHPEKLDLTSTGEQLGAKWTIAPEMRRDSTRADGKPADVYSLAKTLWILLTGHKDGFDGQYDPDSVNGLSRIKLTEPEGPGYFFEEAPPIYIKPLDDLLKISTDNDPQLRPTANQFVDLLSSWVTIYKDFTKRNPLQWRDVQIKLFPTALPQRAVWENVDSIVEILNYLGSVDNLNHVLLPDGGGIDMLGAQQGLEPKTIELIADERTVYIVKPKRLIFESFNFDWEWNYFRLETYELDTTGIDDIFENHEHLFEIAPLQYISEGDWDEDRDGERRYPADYRRIFRYSRGDFLILQKTSPYNQSAYNYGGEHNQRGLDEFKAYISDKVNLTRQMRDDKQLAEVVAEKGFKVDEVIISYLNKVFRQDSFLARRRKRSRSQQPASYFGEEE